MKISAVSLHDKQAQSGGKSVVLLILDPDTRRGRKVRGIPWTLYPGPVTHCIGRWVRLGAGLHGSEKNFLHQLSNSGTSSP